MKYKYLLFDWDGTLLDSVGRWVDAIRKCLQVEGIVITDKEIVSKILNDFGNISQHFPRLQADPLIAQIYETEEIKQIASCSLHKETKKKLDILKKKKYKMAIVTTSFRPTFESALLKHELHNHFQAMITRYDVSHLKPHPEGVLKALSKLGGLKEKKKALFIGDSHLDVTAGRAAGIATAIHFPPEHERYFDLKYVESLKADYIIRDFSELLDLV